MEHEPHDFEYAPYSKRSRRTTDLQHGGPRMSATTSPALADELETLKSRLDALETKNDQLESRVDELETENQELQARVDTLEADTDQLEATVDDQAETIESQQADLAESKARVRKLETTTESAREHRKRLQQQFHELTTDDVATSDDDVTSLSPLQQVVAFSKEAVQELTSNEKRARYVAKGISDYAKKVPAGYTIDSGTIRNVLRSKDDESPHPETVSRVMEFLNRFGKDETKIVKRRGTKRVVFTEQAVADLESTNEESRSITDVVMWWRQ
jgi:ABC-type transporter Mla subunit MlaD